MSQLLTHEKLMELTHLEYVHLVLLIHLSVMNNK